MTQELETALTLVSGGLAVFGFLLSLRKAREDSLRRSEVMAWANQSIAALETLVLICMLRRDGKHPDTVEEKALEVAFESAILVEQGRLFFRNRVADDHGKDKQAAYRGYRPVILDPLVAAHQIALKLTETQAEACGTLARLAGDNLREFVSCIQHEVGRQRTASKFTRAGGQDVNIGRLLDKADPAA